MNVKLLPVNVNIITSGCKSLPVNVNIITSECKSLPVNVNIITSECKSLPVNVNIIISGCKSLPVANPFKIYDDDVLRTLPTVEERREIYCIVLFKCCSLRCRL